MVSSSASDCQAKYQEEKTCYHWTFFGHVSICYLKKEDAPKGGEYPKNGGTSGPKYCPLVSETEKDCFFYKRVYTGACNTGTKLAVSGPEKCQERCQAESGCEFWSYAMDMLADGTNCHLKKQSAPTCGKYHERGISGPKNCA